MKFRKAPVLLATLAIFSSITATAEYKKIGVSNIVVQVNAADKWNIVDQKLTTDWGNSSAQDVTDFTLELHKPLVISKILYKDKYPRPLSVYIDDQLVIPETWTNQNNTYTTLTLPNLTAGSEIRFETSADWLQPSDVQLLENAFDRLDLHNDLLTGTSPTGIDWTNSGFNSANGIDPEDPASGLVETSVTSGGVYGNDQLTVASTSDFDADQLITYLGSNGQYYTAVIESISGNQITLKEKLDANTSTIWNFYKDPSHPRDNGYRAIADYATRNLTNLDKGKHVLLGDSWFATSSYNGATIPSYFAARLRNNLPNATIINAGIGGHTSLQMLNRFDSDVASENPDVVWVMAGTNDYGQGVSAQTYADNVQKIIRKINDLGARAIVFNSSVGQSSFESLSTEYADALESVLSSK